MRKLISTENMTHEEWLKIRQEGIGGSDIAGVLGLSPYKSALSVYMDKTGKDIKDQEENIPAELGLVLEPFMSKKFKVWILKEEGLDIDLKEMKFILQDDTIDYFLVNLDRYFEHPTRGFCPVEIKTTTEFKRKSWTEDEVPDEYYSQVQHQMMIIGPKCKWCYLIVLIGNNTIAVYVIPRNDKFIKDLRDRGTDFWKNFVQKDIPPAPDGSDSAGDALKDLYPEEYPEKQMVLPEEEEDELLEELKRHDDIKLKMKELKKEGDMIKQIVKSKIQDAELMMVCGRKITYKTMTTQDHMVKGSSYRKLAIGK